MKVPKPQDMGMPESIQEWRPGQEDFIESMVEGHERVTANCAPTGFGKTDAAMGGIFLSGKRTAYVTNSKGLQDQIMKKYAPLGVVDVRGRNNYPCDMKMGYSCETGNALGCPYKKLPICPSRMAELRAAVAPVVVTNYDKWTAARCFSEGFQGFQQVVFDESHAMPDALGRALQVILHAKEIEETLEIEFPPVRFRMEIDGWKAWAGQAKAYAIQLMKETVEKIKATSNPKASWLALAEHMRRLAQRLTIVQSASSKNWVVDEIDGGYQFDPIHPGVYAESTMLLKIPRIIMMSATQRPKTLYLCGISKSNSEFKEYDSSFDRAKSPVYWVRTAKVDYRNPDAMRQVWSRLDQFASKRRDRKGIVHTISFDRQRNLLGNSLFSDSMYFKERNEPIGMVLDNFKEAEDGAILVGPSFGTGYDFPGTECEWQYIVKVPFVDGRSKVITARQQLDKEYVYYLAYQALVQMVGRGTRTENDWCENIIPDDNCEWFIPRYAHLAPKSFYGDKWNNIEGFYKITDYLPPPPARIAR